jgi:hypothetical protein
LPLFDVRGCLSNCLQQPRDDPPPYEPAQTTHQSSARRPSTFPPKAKGSGPSNYVTISKSWGAVEGYYLIDPSLPIPPPPLVPPETEQDRKHLKIDVNVGTINVDIGIADPGPAGPSDPVKLSARGGTTGTVNVRVVCRPRISPKLLFFSFSLGLPACIIIENAPPIPPLCVIHLRHSRDRTSPVFPRDSPAHKQSRNIRAFRETHPYQFPPATRHKRYKALLCWRRIRLG